MSEPGNEPEEGHAERRPWRYRMKDLCESTGLPRQAIHFYIQQGLLPPGRKTGRNMALYGDEHLERLRLIKKLQHERFLPLKAIKALLDGRGEMFTPSQHRFLVEVKERLSASLARPGQRASMDAEQLLARTGVTRVDLERAVELGLLGARRDDDGHLQIAEDDAWMVELLGEIRRIGFTEELGYTLDDFAFYQEAMDRMLEREITLLSSRLAGLPPEQVAPMIERVLPLIHAFLTRYHADRYVTSSRPCRRTAAPRNVLERQRGHRQRGGSC